MADKKTYTNLATRVRKHSLDMVHAARASHIGGCLSIADILAVLYSGILHVNPGDPNSSSRDRFILSKGHSCAALYAVLAEQGFFPIEWLKTYCQDGGKLFGHATKNIPGIEVSTGSLGHGLSIGCGIALAGKKTGQNYRVFVLLSDGDCDEGSTWEAVLFASHHRLDNLITIVDYNKMQALGSTSEILNLDPLASKWQSFGWVINEIDGHDVIQIEKAFLNIPFKEDHPSCIIANTIKGKGVSFMENQLVWHYKAPDAHQLEQALKELDNVE